MNVKRLRIKYHIFFLHFSFLFLHHRRVKIQNVGLSLGYLCSQKKKKKSSVYNHLINYTNLFILFEIVKLLIVLKV